MSFYTIRYRGVGNYVRGMGWTSGFVLVVSGDENDNGELPKIHVKSHCRLTKTRKQSYIECNLSNKVQQTVKELSH